VYDSAFWKSTNHSGFFNVQVYVTPRVELFAATTYNRGEGAIGGLMFDPTILPGQPAGLDFIMQSNTMSDFSALDLTQLSQTVGLNVKVSDRFMVHGLFGYNDYSDGHPYMLYDTTGRNTSFMAGLSWVF
jgi:hypothetical protein